MNEDIIAHSVLNMKLIGRTFRGVSFDECYYYGAATDSNKIHIVASTPMTAVGTMTAAEAVRFRLYARGMYYYFPAVKLHRISVYKHNSTVAYGDYGELIHERPAAVPVNTLVVTEPAFADLMSKFAIGMAAMADMLTVSVNGDVIRVSKNDDA